LGSELPKEPEHGGFDRAYLMNTTINFWPLLGVLAVVAGFACRINPMLIVAVAAVVTGLTAHFSFTEILSYIGTDFIKARNLPLVTLLPLPIIGILERNGLREYVQTLILKVRAATAGRVLIVYLFVREITATIGLVSLGGHAQMIRPLIAPMVEGVAKSRFGRLEDRHIFRLRAMSASADNIGLFFGEDIFIAFGGVLFMQAALRNVGIEVDANRIAWAGIPTAICVFLIHAYRLYRMDAWLQRDLKNNPTNRVASEASEECGI